MRDATLAKLMAGGASGGELVGKDDLWQCLFGKANRSGLAAPASTVAAEREVGRFLRGEAAEGRRGDEANGEINLNT
jgi:E3 ubiquitin-protein ligase SHPRH